MAPDTERENGSAVDDAKTTPDGIGSSAGNHGADAGNNNNNHDDDNAEEETPTSTTRPGENDVLLGRGGGTNNHPGNIKFRRLVNEHKYKYIASSKVDKPKVARDVVEIWRKMIPPGRFLARNDFKAEKKNGDGTTTSITKYKWTEVGDKKAREKASQCLRERTPDVQPLLQQIKEQQEQYPGQAFDPALANRTRQQEQLRHRAQQLQAQRQQQQLAAMQQQINGMGGVANPLNSPNAMMQNPNAINNIGAINMNMNMGINAGINMNMGMNNNGNNMNDNGNMMMMMAAMRNNGNNNTNSMNNNNNNNNMNNNNDNQQMAMLMQQQQQLQQRRGSLPVMTSNGMMRGMGTNNNSSSNNNNNEGMSFVGNGINNGSNGNMNGLGMTPNMAARRTSLPVSSLSSQNNNNNNNGMNGNNTNNLSMHEMNLLSIQQQRLMQDNYTMIEQQGANGMNINMPMNNNNTNGGNGMMMPGMNGEFSSEHQIMLQQQYGLFENSASETSRIQLLQLMNGGDPNGGDGSNNNNNMMMMKQMQQQQQMNAMLLQQQQQQIASMENAMGNAAQQQQQNGNNPMMNNNNNAGNPLLSPTPSRAAMQGMNQLTLSSPVDSSNNLLNAHQQQRQLPDMKMLIMQQQQHLMNMQGNANNPPMEPLPFPAGQSDKQQQSFGRTPPIKEDTNGEVNVKEGSHDSKPPPVSSGLSPLPLRVKSASPSAAAAAVVNETTPKNANTSSNAAHAMNQQQQQQQHAQHEQQQHEQRQQPRSGSLNASGRPVGIMKSTEDKKPSAQNTASAGNDLPATGQERTSASAGEIAYRKTLQDFITNHKITPPAIDKLDDNYEDDFSDDEVIEIEGFDQNEWMTNTFEDSGEMSGASPRALLRGATAAAAATSNHTTALSSNKSIGSRMSFGTSQMSMALSDMDQSVGADTASLRSGDMGMAMSTHSVMSELTDFSLNDPDEKDDLKGREIAVGN